MDTIQESSATLPRKIRGQLVASNVLSPRWEHIDLHKEDTLLADELDSSAIRVRNMPTLIMEGDLALASDKLRYRHNWAMHFRMLESEFEGVSILLAMQDVNFSQVGSKVSGSALVGNTSDLCVRRANGVLRENCLAVCHSRLRARINHRPDFANHWRRRSNLLLM